MEILIGADPEIFVRDATTKQFISAHGLLPGTKENPHPVPFGAVQIDGMATEFNIEPAANRRDFVRNIQKVFAQMGEMLPDNVELVPGVPAVTFDTDIFNSQPDEALMLGCEPDFNAYTGLENTLPVPENPAFRTAAGHIHIGWTEGVADVYDIDHFDTCMRLVRHLDATLGVSSLEFDPDTKRRSLYGQAGAFRPKSYGVEYRVLSNAWLTDEALMAQVYDQVVAETQNFFNGASLASNEDVTEFAQYLINTSNVAAVAEYRASVLPQPETELVHA